MQAVNDLGAILGTGMGSLVNRVGTESFDEHGMHIPLPSRPERFGVRRGELRLAAVVVSYLAATHEWWHRVGSGDVAWRWILLSLNAVKRE